MGTRQFVICDRDTDYLKMLQAYLQKRNPADFEIATFDTVDKALRASEENAFEILLVGEKIYDKDVTKIHAAKVYILQEDGLSGITGYSAVAKYQSMESLITQILDAYALDNNCSGIRRCGKTGQALSAVIRRNGMADKVWQRSRWRRRLPIWGIRCCI